MVILLTDPIFRLEGVVHGREDMEDFEGPLSLILQLLSKNKIEIRDISISLILEQYLDYLKKMEEMDLEIASEFVAMASHLAYIKSKVLLADNEEDVSELEQLISSLESLRRRSDYDRIKHVTASFKELFQKGSGYIVKPPEPLKANSEYRYVHDKADLLNAFVKMTRRDDGTQVFMPQSVLSYPKPIIYPVADKAREILQNLKAQSKLRLYTLFFNCKSRSEIVATFISVLQLVKSGTALLTGDGDDTDLTYTGIDTEINIEEEGGADGNS